MQTKLTVSKANAFQRSCHSLILSLLLLTFISTGVFAQKTTNPNLPAFGVVDKADIAMKECDFDEKAEAMILVDEGMLEYVYGRGMEMKRRVRIKILNNKGLDWANVKLQFKSERGDQDISGLEAQTYNLDANGNTIVTKVDKKLFYEKKLNKKYSEKVFTFPEAKVGSVIEYKFKHSGIGIIDWYFQRSIPVRFSQFTIDFPIEVEFASMPFVNREMASEKKNTSTRTISTHSMAKIPGFRDEPFIINEDYYRDRLETKVTAYDVEGKRVNRVANWIQVIKYLMEDEDFGVQLKKNIPRTMDLEEKLKTISVQYDKMKTIYKYVQTNMVWNDYNGIWALDGVKSAWKDKKGTAGEINLILVNLLKDAGLNAHPVLVSTHDNGIVNTVDAGTYDYPGFHQFNKVMAYVEIDKKVFVLDATQKDNPAHLMPDDILLTQGLVIEKIETSEWGWKTLWNDGMAKNVVVINANISEGGKMNGEVTVTSYDYARLKRIATAKKGKEKFIERFVTEANPNLSVDELSFENLDSDSLPLVQKFKFNQALNAAGEYQYFSTNILTGLEKNPFVADTRFSDVFFGYNQSYAIYANFRLPEGYEFDAPPKNIKMIMPDTSITVSRMAQVNGDMLQARIQLDFKKPVYGATEYGELQDFYIRLFELLNEQFVIRKKKKA
jgi:hypothetical protein